MIDYNYILNLFTSHYDSSFTVPHVPTSGAVLWKCEGVAPPKIANHRVAQQFRTFDCLPGRPSAEDNISYTKTLLISLRNLSTNAPDLYGPLLVIERFKLSHNIPPTHLVP